MAEFLTDDEDIVELINILEPQRAARTYQNRENHFHKWSDTDFLKRFGLSKEAVRFVLQYIIDDVASPTDRNHAVSPNEMLLITLRFYAIGTFLQVVEDFIGVDKSTACRIVHKVSRALANLNALFIKMPMTEEEKRNCSQKFYNIARFPKCIGAVDCTHITILSPGGEEPEIFRNTKGFFSINCQVIGNANCKIQSFVCRWAGSCYDSTIFNNSNVRVRFEYGEFGSYLLVGDSGYAVGSFLITPLGNANTAAEQLFNESQIRTRNPIERLFGIWKRRFPVLAMGIRLNIGRVEAVTVATAILHNIACLFKDPLPPLIDEDEVAIELINVDVEQIPGNIGNNVVRQQLIHEYFNGLL